MAAGAGLTVSVAPANLAVRTYTARISQDLPNVGPPIVDVRSAKSVTIQSVGWAGSVSLSADQIVTDVNDPSAVVTASLDRPLAGGYALVLYDNTGRYLGEGNPVSGSNGLGRAWTVTPGNLTTRTYTAYVMLGAYTPTRRLRRHPTRTHRIQ